MKSIIALALIATCVSQVYSSCVKTYPQYRHQVATLDELRALNLNYPYPGFYDGLVYPQGLAPYPAQYPYAAHYPYSAYPLGPSVRNFNHPSVSSYKRPGGCSCGNCVSCKSRPDNLYYTQPIKPDNVC